jgi:acetoin utilization deacetylase AcuC-like enzyme
MLHSEGYRGLTRRMVDVANEVADGRLLVVHEGGYSAGYVPFAGLAVVEALSGIESGVDDPFLDFLAAIGGQEVQPHQKALVDQIVDAGLIGH